MKKIVSSLTLLFIAAISYAQKPVSWTSAEMYQGLQKLKVLGSVLYIAAHPDDENTRLIAYLSKDKLYRTGYLALTRGDGGQNLIGDEQGIELGLIRTQELLSARRIDGGEQFFSRAFDFGFSKGPAETFTKWDREKILSDVVWVIRKFQPDVIITRFPTTGEGGHGHHTASAILANEAFTAAADPTRFPEQLQYVKPWQAKRILWNTFNFGGLNTTSESQFKIDVGGYNPLLGKSYGEIAAESRSQHKSQGFGVPGSRGEALEYFKTTGGTAPVNDLMDGVDISWGRVKDGDVISDMIDNIITSFDFMHPENSEKALVKLYAAVKKMPDGYWRNKKLLEIQQLVEQCSGLFIEAVSSQKYSVQTDSVRINFSLNNRLGSDAMLQEIKVDDFDSTVSTELSKNKNVSFSKYMAVPLSKPISQPYWLQQKMETGYYNVSDQQKIGQPDVDPAYVTHFNIKIDGELFDFVVPVRYRFTDPVKGELYEPLVVVPPLIVSPDQSVKMSRDKNDFEGTLNVTSEKKDIAATFGNVDLGKPDNPKVVISPAEARFTDKDKTQALSYNITANKDNEYDFLLSQDGQVNVKAYDLHEITYPHIPYISYFHLASVVNRKLDLKIYNKKIGYITGAGDKVPEALQQMGYEVTMLNEKDIEHNNLDQYDAIITGVRAYNTNDWMNNVYDKLMQYVNNGGNLVVQYNTSNQIGPVRAKISPYNFDITRTRVTDEDAAVTFLQPGHPVLNFPNKITQDDFKGWIQERSIYHAANWDAHFETILSMNDPGEKPDAGSLIIAKYGKGYFTYTGLVFFRELPAGVPGAYRLLANIIALNKKKGF